MKKGAKGSAERRLAKAKRVKKRVHSARRSAQAYARAREAGQQTRVASAKARFLAAFAETGIILPACLAANVGRRTYYDWMKNDPEFPTLRDEALEDSLDKSEMELVRRGREGVLKPVYQGGVKVGSIREYSDSNLQFHLKGRRPEIFNRDRHELTGPNGAPVAFELFDKARAAVAEKLAQLAARLAESGGAPA